MYARTEAIPGDEPVSGLSSFYHKQRLRDMSVLVRIYRWKCDRRNCYSEILVIRSSHCPEGLDYISSDFFASFEAEGVWTKDVGRRLTW